MPLQKRELDIAGKFEKIMLLQRYHINTVKYYYFKINSDISDIEDICQFENISIRTQSPRKKMDVWLPKWINVDKERGINILSDALKKYNVLIAEAINPEKTIKCGNVAVLDEYIIIEIAYGSGIVDKITSRGIVDKQWITTISTYYKDIEDLDILSVVESIVNLPYINVIIEFSCYNDNVGIYNQRYVVWDILNWKEKNK